MLSTKPNLITKLSTKLKVLKTYSVASSDSLSFLFVQLSYFSVSVFFIKQKLHTKLKLIVMLSKELQLNIKLVKRLLVLKTYSVASSDSSSFFSSSSLMITRVYKVLDDQQLECL